MIYAGSNEEVGTATCIRLKSFVCSYAVERSPVAGMQGVLPNLFKLAPAAGISWFTFEEVKRLLGVDVNS